MKEFWDRLDPEKDHEILTVLDVEFVHEGDDEIVERALEILWELAERAEDLLQEHGICRICGLREHHMVQCPEGR